MNYKSTITKIGELVPCFLEENILIIFNDNAPPELAEISVLHSIESLDKDLKIGDTIQLGENSYTVTAVGSEANHTLKSMGHCTFKFSVENSTELPGEVELKGETLPNLKIGDYFNIIFNPIGV